MGCMFLSTDPSAGMIPPKITISWRQSMRGSSVPCCNKLDLFILLFCCSGRRACAGSALCKKRAISILRGSYDRKLRLILIRRSQTASSSSGIKISTSEAARAVRRPFQCESTSLSIGDSHIYRSRRRAPTSHLISAKVKIDKQWTNGRIHPDPCWRIIDAIRR